LAEGTSKLTVTTVNGGFIDSIELKVAPAIIKVTGVNIIFNEPNPTVNIGSSKIYGGSVIPENATNQGITWESLDPTIAKVSFKKGNKAVTVTGVTLGTARIRVTSLDGGLTEMKTVRVVPFTSLNSMTGEYRAPTGSSCQIGFSNGSGGGFPFSVTVTVRSGTASGPIIVSKTFNNGSSSSGGSLIVSLINFDMPTNGVVFLRVSNNAGSGNSAFGGNVTIKNSGETRTLTGRSTFVFP